jgi:hypothetical protein
MRIMLRHHPPEMIQAPAPNQTLQNKCSAQSQPVFRSKLLDFFDIARRTNANAELGADYAAMQYIK